MSFLYLLTGCLDLARNPGQKKQRLPQAGKTWRDTTPETALILDYSRWTEYENGPPNFAVSFPSKPVRIWVRRRERKAENWDGHLSNTMTSLWSTTVTSQTSKPSSNNTNVGSKITQKQKKERIKFDERCESYLGWMPARAGTEAGNFGLCHAAYRNSSIFHRKSSPFGYFN